MKHVSYLYWEQSEWWIDLIGCLDICLAPIYANIFANIKLHIRMRGHSFWFLFKTWLLTVGRGTMFDDYYFSSLHWQWMINVYVRNVCNGIHLYRIAMCLWLTVPSCEWLSIRRIAALSWNKSIPIQIWTFVWHATCNIYISLARWQIHNLHKVFNVNDTQQWQ